MEQEAPTSWTMPFRMKDCSLSFSRLIKSWRRFLSNIPGKFAEIGFFLPDGKGLKKKLNAQQPENYLEFLQNPFFLSFESILIN